MKKIEIQNAVNALGGIPVNRIKDDRVRSSLIRDYRLLRKASREIEQERADIVEKFRADFVDSLLDVKVLRDSGRPVVGHDDFLRAEAATNMLIEAMFQEEFGELDLERVSLDDFVRQVRDGEYTFEDLACLECIID